MKVYVVTYEGEILKIYSNEFDAQTYADNYEQRIKEFYAYPVYVNVDEYEVE